MQVPIEKIKCDIRGRTNVDVSELSRLLITYGQQDPLLVEGPDEEGFFYLVHGYLRYHAMLKNQQQFPLVKCTVQQLTSQENRNALRLILTSSSKKVTGLDQQLVYEELENVENRDELIPKNKRSRMINGANVPQDMRIEYEKIRRSQDALSFIYGLEGLGSYKDKLLKKLTDGEITTIHADALKKIIKHLYYKQLTLEQKMIVIEKALKNAKFTSNDAGFMIFEEMMKNEPKSQNINNWIEYICDEIENAAELIHDDLNMLTTEIQQKKLNKSIKVLNEKLEWLNDKRKKDSKNVDNVIWSKENKNGSKDNVDEKTNKRMVIMEKRDGNKLTFYFG